MAAGQGADGARGNRSNDREAVILSAPYVALLRSFAGQFLDRKYAFRSARLNASLALSIWIFLNAVSLVEMLGTGLRLSVFSWTPSSALLWFTALLTVAGVNWCISFFITPGDVGLLSEDSEERRECPGRNLWRWYTGLSVVIFIAATIHSLTGV